MVSGRDRHPPEYEPDIGWGGRIVLLAIIALVLLASLGWLFV